MNQIALIIIYLSTILTNIPLERYFGTIGASPVVFILVPLALFFTIGRYFTIKRKDFTIPFAIYFIITFLVSLVWVLLFYLIYGIYDTPYGESIFSKLLRASSYNFVYFCYVLCLENVFRNLSSNHVAKYSYVFFVLLFTVGLMQYLDVSDFGIFHSDQVNYSRVRLLSGEPSIAALIINVFGGMALLYSNGKYHRLTILVMILFANLYVGSKVSLLFILISIVCALFLTRMTISKLVFYAAFLFASLFSFSYYFNEYLLRSLIIDIENYTSLATRASTMLWGLVSLFKYPFGEGYGTYLNLYSDILLYSMGVIQNITPFNLNFSEVSNMIDTGKNVAVKSGVLSQVVYNGMIALIFYVYLYVRSFVMLSQTKNIGVFEKLTLRILLFYTFFSILLSVNIELAYAYVIPLVYINIFGGKD